MAKRSARRISKKYFDKTLLRVGKGSDRHWLYRGERYDTLRDVRNAHWMETLKILQEGEKADETPS